MNYVELDEFPHGRSCPECGQAILAGQQYTTRTVNDDWDEIVCPNCATTELSIADAAHLYLISQKLNPEPTGA